MRNLYLSTALFAAAGTIGTIGLHAASVTPIPVTAAAAAETKAWRGATAKFARANFKAPDMGYEHSERVYHLAAELAREDGVTLDDDVLYAASLLHDVAEFKPWAKAGEDHSDVGADIAPVYLKKFGFPMEKIAAVQAAIRTHMYYRDPVGEEARYLHDADALEGLGAVGVMRFTAMIDDKDTAANGAEMMAVIRSNLAQIPDRLVTPAGRRHMPERRDQMQDFVDSLELQTASYTPN